MEPQEKCEMLAGQIREIISEGIDLSADVVHFIDSTFANPSVKALEALLAEDSDCEGDTLMELLFFPGESVQIRLEEMLERYRLQKEDEDRLISCLCRQPLQATFRFEDDRGAFEVRIPAEVIRQFVVRLKITKHLEADLIESIGRYGDDRNTNRFKAKIRNSRFSPSGSKTGFVCLFFDKIGAGSTDVFECLEFLLGFLDEIKKDDDIYQALMAKKKSYFLGLQKAKKMEARIEKHNIETLLMQGERVVLIDQADALKKMRIIDRISRAVFGKTEFLDHLAGDETQIEVGSPEDIESILKNLS